MTYAGGAAASGAAAAAAAAKRRQEEEEHMTPYTPEELNEDWEFKIVRSTLEAFRSPEKLKLMLKEESRAGWTLVEKFDNGRVRLKRPAHARRNDHTLPPDVDPYRTTYGTGEFTLAMTIMGVVVALAFGIILLIMMMNV